MFQNVIDILNNHFSDNWFLDSGSLLGVIRDNKFLKNDLGIDISVICDSYNDEKVLTAVKELEKLGFIASAYQWDGKTYKYCFVPLKKNPCTYSFDLHLFRSLNSDVYVCPQVSLKKGTNNIIAAFRSLKKGNPLIRKKGIPGWFKYVVGYIYRYIFKYFGKKMNMSKYARAGGLTFFWCIPKMMFHGTEPSYQNFNVLINPDQYLSYRYGNWHVPVSEWITIRDDGGLEKCTINEISDFLKKQ